MSLILMLQMAFTNPVFATSKDVQETIKVEAKGSAYSIVDSRIASKLEGNSIYFFNKDGSVNRAFLKLSGSLGDNQISDEIEASSLPGDNECESPCASLESDQARKNLICSGTCSYGAPLFLTVDDKRQLIFLAVPFEASKNAKFSAYTYSTKDKNYKIVGHFYAQTIKDSKFDRISGTLKVNVMDSLGKMSKETIKIE